MNLAELKAQLDFMVAYAIALRTRHMEAAR